MIDPTSWLLQALQAHPKLIGWIVIALTLRGFLSAVLKAYAARVVGAGRTVPVWLLTVQDVISWVPQPGKWGALGIFNVPGVPSFGGPSATEDAPPAKRESGSASLGLLALIAGGVLVALAFSGCGFTMTDYYRHTATVLNASETCYEVGSATNRDKEGAFKKLALDGDKTSAKLQAETWRPKYDKILLSCDALRASGRTALYAAPVVEKGINREKNIRDWVIKSGVLIAASALAYSEVGVKFPPEVK